MSSKEKENVIYNLEGFFIPKITTGKGHFKDPKHPTCVNHGCNDKVHNQFYKGGKPHYRSVCFHCHNAGRKGSKVTYKEGVTPVKRDYCENYLDNRFGEEFICPTKHDKTKINKAQETGVLPSRDLDMDHKDGNHYNNVPENQQTLCKACHGYKTDKNDDLKTRGIYGTTFIRGEKVKKEDLRVPKAVPIEHDFFGEE